MIELLYDLRVEIIGAFLVLLISMLSKIFIKDKIDDWRLHLQFRKNANNILNYFRQSRKHFKNWEPLFTINNEETFLTNYVSMIGKEFVYNKNIRNSNHLEWKNLENELLDSLSVKRNNHYFIIGELGTGKSFLATFLTHKISDEFIKNKVKFSAIYIPMRYLYGDELIGDMANFISERLNITLINKLKLIDEVRKGKILLILDGLDEYIKLKENRDAVFILKQLEEILVNDSLIIITSRPSIFHTPQELNEYFRGRLVSSSLIADRIYATKPMRIIELQPLSNQQINNILKLKNLKDQKYIDLIFQNESILNLCRHHILLDMIIKTLPLMVHSGTKIHNITTLYELYISEILKKEKWRISITESQAWDICERIALEMFNRQDEELSESQMNKIALSVIFNEYGVVTTQKSILFDVRSSLLLSSTRNNNYRFFHRSITEFFVAKGLVTAIRRNNFSGLDLKNIVYHESISHFSRYLLTITDFSILENYLDHSDTWVRFIAAHYLSRLESRKSITSIQNRLVTEKNFIVRREFFIALAFLGLTEHFHNYIIELDTNQQNDETNNNLVIEYFGDINSAIEGCAHRLTERKDYPTREMIIRFLGQKGSRKQIPVIRKFLDDNISHVKEAAQRAISEIKSRVKVPELIKAIFIDLDGVIVDSIEDHIISWQKAVKDIFNVYFDPFIIRQTEGMKSNEILKNILNSKNIEYDDSKLKETIKLKKEFMSEIDKFSIYEEMIDLLKKAKKREVIIGIVTGSDNERVKKVIEKIGIDLIDFFISADDEIDGKPSPAPYLCALKKANVKNTEAVVIENAPIGIDSAQYADIFCIAITSTLNINYLFSADKICENLQEISNFLFNGN